MVRITRPKSGGGKSAGKGRGRAKAGDLADPVLHEAPDAGTADTGSGYGVARLAQMDSADKVRIAMPYAPFTVQIIDVDVMLVFGDGSRVIVPNMALASFSGHKPSLVFDDRTLTADDLIATVGEIKEHDSAISMHLASGTEAGAGEEKADAVQPGDSEQTQAAEAQQEQNQHKSDEAGKALTEKISNTVSSTASAPGVISARSATPAPDDALGPAGIGKLVPKLTYTLFNSEGVTNTTENGQTVIKGDTGAKGSSTDASYAGQSATETLTGTGGDDVIYADNPAHAPAGTSLRVLHVVAEVPAKNLGLLQVLIPSLPAGYAVANATHTADGWLVDATQGNITRLTQISVTDPVTGKTTLQTAPASESFFTFDVQLIYAVPSTAAAANSSGFQKEFYLPVELGLSTDGKTSTYATQVSNHFGVKTVNTAGDMTVTDTIIGDPVYVLFSNPPGNVINAGDGNDTIHAGAGADQIDGGTGTNTVVYDLSNEGVTVDLGTGKGSGGFAQGDTYANIQNVTGSAFNDTLIGDAHDNVFDGGAGADHIDGGVVLAARRHARGTAGDHRPWHGVEMRRGT